MKRIYDKLVDKCRESDPFAWFIAVGGVVLMVVIGVL